MGSSDGPPGLRPERLLRLIRRSVAECGIDLGGATVLTEAATGAYVVTPVIAALAAAGKVHAVTRGTRYGSVQEVVAQTDALAALAGVADRIEIHTEIAPELVGAADIVTNSGHLRPLDASLVGGMRPGTVVPLMFEAWEIDLGRDDVDLAAMRRQGVRFAGTNERHPAVDVFSFLGSMAVKLLVDSAVAVRGSRLVVVCDNPFRRYLVDGLTAAGASVQDSDRLDDAQLTDGVDAVVVALKPTGAPVLSADDVARIARQAPGAVLAQFWGDLPRDACRQLDVPCVPAVEPGTGHMGVLPSALGPEPVVRLQAAGLKVASVLLKPPEQRSAADRSFLDEC